MRLSLAANYDADIVPDIARYPVHEVYGKLPADVVGGGRPSYMSGRLNLRRLAGYVKALQRHDIGFNYLLNSACLGNREWSRRWQKQLDRLLRDLWSIGIRRVTVSTPWLLERIKRAYPDMHVRVGIFAQVDTPRRARFWQDLGADAITLESFSINRNFARLRQIRDAVDCELQLIANHICMPNCALQAYHQNGFAHASNGGKQLFIDYCLLRCTRHRMEDPSLLIRAQWIRPEDTAYYESLGYDCFKLLERNMPSAPLLQRVQAYSERRSPPDLADLLLPYGFRETPAKSAGWFWRYFLRPWQLRPWRLKPLVRFTQRQGMLAPVRQRNLAIESAAIPADILESFARRDCAAELCNGCDYCRDVADKAVTLDRDAQARDLDDLARIEDDMTTGALWR